MFTKIDEKMKPIMMDLFNTYDECDDILEALRSLCSEGEITDQEYDRAIDMWNDWLI